MNDKYTDVNTQRFLELYKELEAIEKDDFKKYENIKKRNFSFTETCRYTRNILSHNTVNKNHPIAVSHDVVIKLEKLIDSFKQKSFNACIKFENIKHVTYESKLTYCLKLMAENNFSYLPIVVNGVIEGVISEKSILNILNDNPDGLLYDEKNKIGEFKTYFSLDNNPNEYFIFINKEEELYITKDRFVNLKNNKKVGLVFITHNGKSNEKILGLVSSWDVLSTTN